MGFGIRTLKMRLMLQSLSYYVVIIETKPFVSAQGLIKRVLHLNDHSLRFGFYFQQSVGDDGDGDNSDHNSGDKEAEELQLLQGLSYVLKVLYWIFRYRSSDTHELLKKLKVNKVLYNDISQQLFARCCGLLPFATSQFHPYTIFFSMLINPYTTGPLLNPGTAINGYLVTHITVTNAQGRSFVNTITCWKCEINNQKGGKCVICDTIVRTTWQPCYVHIWY